MVGVGGGAPSQKHDIRLGDIVVSSPHDGHSGDYHYDYRTTIETGALTQAGFIDQAPIELRTALAGLRSEYVIKGHNIQGSIEVILKSQPQIGMAYCQPRRETDRLYASTIIHDTDASRNDTMVLSRSQRAEEEDDPRIHYGTIASGCQLVEDASLRDQLSRNQDILCFETEAAAGMNELSRLVIRGICDYCDAHKNELWQGYASMTAATLAADLLRSLPPC